MNYKERLYNLLTETETIDPELQKKHEMYARLVKLGLAGPRRMHRQSGTPTRVKAVKTAEGWLRRVR